ncbi:MAG: hypothetical protein ABEJ44_04975 [Halanaeroarchaeum sp.]
MVTYGDLYLALTTLVLLFVLVKTLPVLRGIIAEGIDRQRTRRSDEPEREIDEGTDGRE